MKKILTGAVAALALLFGFSSCSGELHDSVVSELFVAGDIQASANARGKFTMIDDTTQKYDFTYDAATMTYWGGSKGTVNFKICQYEDVANWTQDWGWKKDKSTELTINDEDYLELEARDAANSNPGNLVLKDLEDGQAYSLLVKYDAPAKKVEIKVTGSVTDYPTLRVVNTTDNETYMMKRTGSKYEYVFTPETDGTFDFYVTNGYLFWGDDGDMETSEPASLSTISYEKRNYASGNAVQYAIYADASTLLTNQELTITSGEYDTTILAKAGIAGTMNGYTGAPLTRVDELEYEFEFTNAGSEAQIVIQEICGSWDTRWFAGVGPNSDGKETTATMMDDVVAAKYGETAIAQNPLYYAKDPGMAGSNIKITGLPYGVGYKFIITIKIVDESSKKLEVSCAAAESIPSSAYDASNYDSCYKLNNINYVCSSYGNYQITWGSKDSEGNYIGTVTIPAGTTNTWGGTTFEFGVCDTTSWGTKFVDGVLSTADTYVVLTKAGSNNNSIPAVTGAALANDVTITLKSTESTISAKYTLAN